MEEKLQLSAKYPDFSIFSSEPKYDHILLHKPKLRKLSLLYFLKLLKLKSSYGHAQFPSLHNIDSRVTLIVLE